MTALRIILALIAVGTVLVAIDVYWHHDTIGGFGYFAVGIGILGAYFLARLLVWLYARRHKKKSGFPVVLRREG